MPIFQFGTTTIPYSIDYRPNKKEVVISIRWQEGMKVTAPKRVSQAQIEEILEKKASWIVEKYKEISKIAPPPQAERICQRGEICLAWPKLSLEST